MSEHSNCLNCGARLEGNFCASCGQHAHDGRNPTLGHFAHDLIHELLHVDGKIGQTLKALIFQPGRLTAEYWQGRMTAWIRPLRLFLTAVALNLLIVHHGVGPMNFRVRVDLDAQGNRNVSVSPDADSKPTKEGFRKAPDAESAAFFEKFRKSYASVRYVSVVLFSVASWLLYRRRQPYFVNHLIFGFHYYSFWYASSLLGGFLSRGAQLMVFVIFVYLVFSLRRVYGESRWRTLAKGVPLFAGLVAIEMVLAWAAINLAGLTH